MSEAKIDALDDDTLLEALSHFDLVQLDDFRKVSPKFHKACDRRKEYIHNLLNKQNASVEIVGLSSERGKQINHRLAVVDGPINNGRYPVKMRHLTGEVEKVSLKPQNLNPFLKPDQEADEKSRLDFISYSSDAKIREGHGRLLDQVLMLLRYAVNVMNGYSIFDGDFESFMRLPRQETQMANIQIFSMYRVKPSNAGYHIPGDMSILDSTIHTLAEHENSAIEEFGQMANYERDGSGGKLIVRNLVRFMESWDKERIHGEFWISKIVKSGTLVVQKNNEFGEPELGKVYLVKGIGSQVGSQVPKSRLPLLVRTTFLPLYDILVYDGIMMASEVVPISQSLKDKIEKHVTKAVREQTVVYRGESAASGLWDTEPPELEKPVPIDGQKPTALMVDGGVSDTGSYTPTSQQLSIATKIIKFAQKRGYKANKVPGMPLLIARRMGYTKEDNPMQCVGLMYHINNTPRGIHPFRFKTWPTYTLDELLPEVLKVLESSNIMPGLIWVDEKSLVVPLRQVLLKANEAVCFPEKVEVEWYPPPSEEEQAYHNRF